MNDDGMRISIWEESSVFLWYTIGACSVTERVYFFIVGTQLYGNTKRLQPVQIIWMSRIYLKAKIWVAMVLKIVESKGKKEYFIYRKLAARLKQVCFLMIGYLSWSKLLFSTML